MTWAYDTDTGELVKIDAGTEVRVRPHDENELDHIVDAVEQARADLYGGD